MEASCFVASKPCGKALDLQVPPARTRALVSHRRWRSHGCSSRRGGDSSRATTLLCCGLGPVPSPDDDRAPALQSDWRSFRARLVAGQRAARPEWPAAGQSGDPTAQTILPQVTLGDMWAHTLHEPERGCLLVATEKLDGVHIFERTVILLLSVGPVGPTGIILNRPSLMSIKETRSVTLDVAGTFSDRPLFFGGPLEEGLFLVSPREGRGAEEEGVVARSGVFDEVMNGVYYGTKESVGCAAEMVKRSVVGVQDFSFFDGYCRWEREQLRDEIRVGYWTVAACSAGVIGNASVGSGSLWEEILGLVGERKVR